MNVKNEYNNLVVEGNIITHKIPLSYQLKGSYQWISCVIDYYVNSSCRPR